MAYAETFLGSGQVGSTKAALYTVPASTTALLTKLVLFHSTGSTAETVKLYYNDGTSRQFMTLTLNAGESAELDLKGVVLETTDDLEAETTTASVVNWFLFGVLKT